MNIGGRGQGRLADVWLNIYLKSLVFLANNLFLLLI
jgi:hypothetical protein